MTTHIPCRDCPAFRQYMSEDWTSPIYAEKIGPDGKPLMDSMGKPILVRDREGEPVSWGACGARLPTFGAEKQTHVTMRSDWWCESKEKHEILARVHKKR